MADERDSQETKKERLEREHGELLEELRALIPGAELLFGFLLAIRFTGQFGELGDAERYVYYLTLVATGVALVLFMAPAAYHRLRFREGDKDYMLRKANREAIVGTFAIAVAFAGVVYIITELVFGQWQAIVAGVAFFAFAAWRWWSFALYRSLRESG